MTDESAHGEKPENEGGPDGRPAAGDSTVVLARHLLPPRLPVIPLKNRPFFPKMMIPFIVEDEKTQKLLQNAIESKSKYVGLVLARGEAPRQERAGANTAGLYDVGVVAEILQSGRLNPEMPMQVLFGVLDRFRIVSVVAEDPYIVAEVSYFVETDMKDNRELKAYSLALIQAIKELVKLNPLHKEELSMFMNATNLSDPGRLADFSAALTTASGHDLQQVLATISIRARSQKVLVLLRKELDIAKLQTQISAQIEQKISSRQREFFLQEQLKAIKKELGLSKEGPQAEYERFEERLKTLTLPEEAASRIGEEMDKLKLLEPASPEFNVTRNYLEWLTSLPWGVMTDDNYDIARASRILNRDHYGLEDVKERILEFLAVGKMKGNISGSILCFVGPPGVGKTSVGKSIAAGIGRRFYRFSLGGMRDEAEIKGHRRTYIGALPGKFIQAIKHCKSANPVIMLDEIDKLGVSFQGDPASALLEVLDPEQNRDFLDHYMDVRFDLSNVLFICTANLADTIPKPLLDRMEVMRLAGYIRHEKMRIASKFLIPKQSRAHGLKPSSVRIGAKALAEIIDGYAREPGVRDLENNIKKIMRKAARTIVEKKARTVSVEARDVARYLGRRVFTDRSPFSKPLVGVARGLAWTSMGGDTLYVEAARVEADKRGFKQTGQLGNVMVESSEIAYTYIRSLLNANKNARELFDKSFVHLHVPAGATPKDGPSAGITMAAALYSLAVNKPIRSGCAMTGELTLSGVVMPVGGIKEKTIAARRARVRTLVLPAENRKDFEELPAHVRKSIRPVYVSTFPDVVRQCFRGSPVSTRSTRRRGTQRSLPRKKARPGKRDT